MLKRLFSRKAVSAAESPVVEPVSSPVVSSESITNWTQLYVLGGFGDEGWHSFADALKAEVLGDQDPDFKQLPHAAETALRALDPELYLASFDVGLHTLCRRWRAVDFSRNPKESLEKRRLAGEPLEFCFRGSSDENPTIRQVRIRRVFDGYFRGENALGIRNYDYRKIEWVSFSSKGLEPMASPRTVLVSFYEDRETGEKRKGVFLRRLDKLISLQVNGSQHYVLKESLA